MLWFTIHHIFQLLPSSIETKTRDLSTFLFGTFLYAFLYSYFKTYGQDHPFLTCFLNFTLYIILADAFVMGVIYKNFYRQTIFTEVKETFGCPLNDIIDTKSEQYIVLEKELKEL